jgi:hypothetical protein
LVARLPAILAVLVPSPNPFVIARVERGLAQLRGAAIVTVTIPIAISILIAVAILRVSGAAKTNAND